MFINRQQKIDEQARKYFNYGFDTAIIEMTAETTAVIVDIIDIIIEILIL